MATPLDKLRIDLYGEGYDTNTFSVSKMVGTSLKWARIKIPHVKEVVMKYKDSPNLELEDIPLDESVELTIVYFGISLLRLRNFDAQMNFLKKKLKYDNSWMITDMLSQYLKKGSSDVFLPYYLKFCKSKAEYTKRFSYVMAMKYSREDISPFLNHLVYDDEYYVYMAQAWMLATFAIWHFDEVCSFLKKDDCPTLLKRKTISKIIDSYRLNDEQKNYVRHLRSGLN